MHQDNHGSSPCEDILYVMCGTKPRKQNGGIHRIVDKQEHLEGYGKKILNTTWVILCQSDIKESKVA